MTICPKKEKNYSLRPLIDDLVDFVTRTNAYVLIFDIFNSLLKKIMKI